MAPAVSALIAWGPTLIRTVGSLFGGKTSEAANTVANLVDQVKGQPASMAEAKLAAEMAKLPPETLIAFEQVKVRLAEIEKEREANRLADVQSARARDVELRKAGHDNRRADVMVIGVVIGLITCLAVLIFFRKDIPGEAVGIISTIAGIFGSCLKDAFAFEFGSSRGSKEKDEVLGEIARMP